MQFITRTHPEQRLFTDRSIDRSSARVHCSSSSYVGVIDKMGVVTREIVKCVFVDRRENKWITYSLFIRVVGETFIEILRLTRVFLERDKTESTDMRESGSGRV